MNAKISSLGHTLISQIEQISMLHFILARCKRSIFYTVILARLLPFLEGFLSLKSLRTTRKRTSEFSETFAPEHFLTVQHIILCSYSS